METLATGLGVLEGPVTAQDGSIVATSIDQGRVYRVSDGKAEVLAETGGGPNGTAEGRGGRFFIAQNGGAAPARNDIPCRAGVQLIDTDRSVRLFGEGMVAPNDLCFGPDGYLYVTDPTRKPERDDGRIWRCDLETLQCEPIFSCDWYPNGIGFSEEDDVIYVADSRHCRIVRMPLHDMCEAQLETVVRIDHGIPDGFAFDVRGDLLVACPDFNVPGDVQVYRDGRLVDLIAPGDSNLYLNLAVSSDSKLYLCDSSKGQILVADWACPGLPLHPFR